MIRKSQANAKEKPPPAATPIPLPTSTPALPSSSPDPRFGVIADGSSAAGHLETLGVKWYIDGTPDPRNAPPGTHKVPFIAVKPGRTRLTPQQITDFASGAPGSVWYIGGEPNVSSQDGISASAYVTEFDYYAPLIRGVDPSARIMGPSILNWSFDCTGCPGYPTGEQWMTGFFDAYRAAHGGDDPPIDIWAIDTYPLTWTQVPMVDWILVVNQITGYREFLDSELLPSAPKTIWVTEIASHWAYSEWIFDSDGFVTLPAHLDWQDDFLWDQEGQYLIAIADWLKANSASMQIERWFFYKTYVNLPQSAAKFAYAGMHFFEGPGPEASLNQLGEIYRDYATGVR